jgi:hypothetical protein
MVRYAGKDFMLALPDHGAGSLKQARDGGFGSSSTSVLTNKSASFEEI